jgi:hypothetical protein
MQQPKFIEKYSLIFKSLKFSEKRKIVSVMKKALSKNSDFGDNNHNLTCGKRLRIRYEFFLKDQRLPRLPHGAADAIVEYTIENIFLNAGIFYVSLI